MSPCFDRFFIPQHRLIPPRPLLFQLLLMNVLLHGKLLPAEQMTLDTPEARSFFLHLSLCGCCEGQGTRIQTHWNRHGGIWEFMKQPNWKPNKSNLGNLIKKLALLLSSAEFPVWAWSWFDCYSFCTLLTDSFCQCIVWCWRIITAGWVEVSVITEVKICWMGAPSNLYLIAANP